MMNPSQLLLVLILLAMLATLGACDLGGDSGKDIYDKRDVPRDTEPTDTGGNYHLSSGSYVISDYAALLDGCDLLSDPNDVNGDVAEITVEGSVLTLETSEGAGSGTLVGDGFEIARLEPYKVDDPPCMYSVSETVVGMLIADDVVSLTDTITITLTSGEAGVCAAIFGGSLPCTSRSSLVMTKQ